jgi:hypothetical protein
MANKRDRFNGALFHEWSLSLLKAHPGLKIFKDAREAISEGPALKNLLLSTPNLGRCHEAHGLSDLAGVLDRFDPISDVFEICHVGCSVSWPKRPWWTRLR